ncbi:YqaJ-like viral recombinase domain [Popillia japonica]|uniref:YqaJ-like viral recombinase domain n=1 Tax=Popillia japonica TaxID=7064 RepID=A0AAW1JUA9_POPJA
MIDAQTRGQNANPQWIEERAFRLTASNFGSICKMRSTASRAKRGEQLLYSNFFGNTATKYGVENDGVAIKDFEKIYNVAVNPCGFFIHSSHPYLGASPDGLAGNDGIIEMKCPKCKNFHPRDAIQKGIINFATLSNNDDMILKQNNNYYYQVQRQLEVANREYCYFVVRSPMGMLVERVSSN